MRALITEVKAWQQLSGPGQLMYWRCRDFGPPLWCVCGMALSMWRHSEFPWGGYGSDLSKYVKHWLYGLVHPLHGLCGKLLTLYTESTKVWIMDLSFVDLFGFIAANMCSNGLWELSMVITFAWYGIRALTQSDDELLLLEEVLGRELVIPTPKFELDLVYGAVLF